MRHPVHACLAAACLVAAASSSAAAAAPGLDCKATSVPPDARVDTALADPGFFDSRTGQLQAAIRRLTGEGVPLATIVDRAVAAYCPIVSRDAALTLDQKREHVRRFAASLAAAVYDPTGAPDEILITVPVPSALSRQIDISADRAGQSVDAWVVAALRAHLAGNPAPR